MLLLTIFIVSVVAVYLSGKELLIGSESISDEVPSSSSTFAIMVENDDGDYEEYTESETWPSGMVFNSSMSFCQDKDGATIEESLTYSNGYATLTSSDTSYCWLYFRNYGTTATLDTIIVVLSSGTSYACTSTTCSYTAGSGDTYFKIYASVDEDSYATFYFSNATSTVYSDSATSSSYTLTAGSTTTGTVKVTSEDGSTTKTYTIKVTKSDSDSTATITSSVGSLTCGGSTTSCTLTAACASGSGALSITLTATATSSYATLSWSTNTVSVACGGTSTQTLTVTAQDGSTTTYTVKITRPSYSTGSSSSGGGSSSSGSCVCLVWTTTYSTNGTVTSYKHTYGTGTGTCSNYSTTANCTTTSDGGTKCLSGCNDISCSQTSLC